MEPPEKPDKQPAPVPQQPPPGYYGAPAQYGQQQPPPGYYHQPQGPPQPMGQAPPAAAFAPQQGYGPQPGYGAPQQQPPPAGGLYGGAHPNVPPGGAAPPPAGYGPPPAGYGPPAAGYGLPPAAQGAPYPPPDPSVYGNNAAFPQANPVAAPTAVVVGDMAAPAGQAPDPSFDCILCESLSQDSKGTMKRRSGSGGEEERCEECRQKMVEDAPYYQCVGKNGESGCGRKVCAQCADMSRTERKHSRWNHNEPNWKATLLGCGDGHAGLTAATILCYYHPMFGVLANSDVNFNPEDSPNGCEVIFMGLFGIFFVPHVLIFELLCVSVCSIHDAQDGLKQRFGLEPKSCAEAFFCRWCFLARMKREMAMRGYLQPYVCCGPSKDEAERAIPPPQPGVPRPGSIQYVQAPNMPQGMY